MHWGWLLDYSAGVIQVVGTTTPIARRLPELGTERYPAASDVLADSSWSGFTVPLDRREPCALRVGTLKRAAHTTAVGAAADGVPAFTPGPTVVGEITNISIRHISRGSQPALVPRDLAGMKNVEI